VPDISGSNRRSDEWLFRGQPEEALVSLTKTLQRMGGRIELQGHSGATVEMGSGSKYRMLGWLTPLRHMPIAVSISVAARSADTLEVSVTATSREGWYLMNATPRINSRVFNRAFTRLFSILREAAVPIPAS